MRRFWRFLLRKSLPPDSLAATAYAVFGLGDSGYPKFNVGVIVWPDTACALLHVCVLVDRPYTCISACACVHMHVNVVDLMAACAQP